MDKIIEKYLKEDGINIPKRFKLTNKGKSIRTITEVCRISVD